MPRCRPCRLRLQRHEPGIHRGPALHAAQRVSPAGHHARGGQRADPCGGRRRRPRFQGLREAHRRLRGDRGPASSRRPRDTRCARIRSRLAARGAEPRPQDIVELETVRDLMEDGCVESRPGAAEFRSRCATAHTAVDFIVDKDLTSAILAWRVRADILVILTAVEKKVYLDFGKPTQKALDAYGRLEARAYMEQGQFAPGSMLPKVQACVKFVEATGRPRRSSLARIRRRRRPAAKPARLSWLTRSSYFSVFHTWRSRQHGREGAGRWRCSRRRSGSPAIRAPTILGRRSGGRP